MHQTTTPGLDESKLPLPKDQFEQYPLPHSCIHCKDIVVDAVAGWSEPGLLLEYTTINELVRACSECLFIRSTLACWESKLAQYELRRSKNKKSKPKPLFWFKSRAGRRPNIQLYIEFKWNHFSMTPGKSLGAVELQWSIDGEIRDARPFLVHSNSGEFQRFFYIYQDHTHTCLSVSST
jgi:hypothetical protein